ncbi:PREDICTED: solute carrier family 25 member 46-like isoform X1 [Rhagoletis zephyria]|uniref:solute carrier family 25 member 46-like isoform X1 n=1 Tax=Rhagoletis zephyria TaxID=28612 RepID=UPI000811A73E|nr:PREDICTED: solute carrier family 25 member 46-like isoform X1 [Rhagoletis zephyria]
MAGMNNYSTLMYATNQKNEDDDSDEPGHQTRLRNIYSAGQVQGSMMATSNVTTSASSHVPPNTLNLQRSHIHLPVQDDRHTQAYLDSLAGSAHDVTAGGLIGMKYVNSERDLSLPLEKHKALENYYDSQEDARPTFYRGFVADGGYKDEAGVTQISIRKYLGIGVQWVSLVTENLLSHPFIVLRRQCQVYNASKRYHLHPFSLVPSIIHLHRRQGVTTLWKGLGSCLLVRGMSLAVDDVVSKITQWPKEVDSRTSLKRFGQHLILKCVSIAIVMPFYSASLVETVQSDIASEKPGLFDVFREGSLRLLYWSSPQKGRMLPAWALIGPCMSVGITKYLFGLVIKGISSRIMRRRIQQAQERKGAKYKDDSLENQNVEIYSNLISMLTTEIIFYPFETILHRIQLQGTRTIIDNLDNGYAVVPILTNYQGAIDCYRTTVATEGFSGLYKGFGAIVLQFAAHIAVIKLTKWVVTQITEVVSSRPPQKVMQYYNLDRGLASNSTTISPSLSSNSELDVQSLGNHSVD